MAKILNDKEISKLIGTVIVNGDPSCIRPNSYVLRLGTHGEFINTGKEFSLGSKKKGIRVQPGHSVGLTAFENIDFRRETVRALFEDSDLHAFLSPTTDLSREGIVAPTTQVDAGYFGTLNWTIANTSSEERMFVFKERIYRITFFRLEKGESPEDVYQGEYQEQIGYVRSKRTGAPVGMKESEWEDAHTSGGPEDILESLMNSGYPWHGLGQRLKVIDDQFKSVTSEYSEISDSIGRLTADINQVKETQNSTANTVREVLKEETVSLQNRWFVGLGLFVSGLIGAALTVTSNEPIYSFVKEYSSLIGIGLIAVTSIGAYVVIKK